MATLVSLQSIPHELVLHTLAYCDYLSILRFSSTCKRYQKLIAGSNVAQLQIELGASGFQLSDEAYRSRTEITASQLLEEFRRYRDGWLYLRLGTAPRVASNVENTISSKLQQGVHAEVLVDTPGLPMTMRLTRLSTGATHTLPGLLFSEFQIDPSQDLLVLVSMDGQPSPWSAISLRSLQDGTSHGSTYCSNWNVTHPFALNSGVFIEVSGDLLAIQYSSFGEQMTEVIIWDWKRAVLLGRIKSAGTCHTFRFLTSNSLVLVQSTAQDPPRINFLIYQDVRASPTSLANSLAGSFVVSKYGCLKPHACFEFLAVTPGSVVRLHLQSEPAPSVTSSSSSTFLPLPETRILQLNMTVMNPSRILDRAGYQIFISIQKLLAHLPTFGDHAGLGQDLVRIPWTDWGEYSTRWFDTPGLHIFPRGAYGTRSVQYGPLSNEGEEASQEHVSILDFHTPTVRRFSSLGCDTHLAMWPSKDARCHMDWHTACESTEYKIDAFRNAMATDQGKRVFVDTIDEDVPSEVLLDEVAIRTRLPYRIVTRVQPFTCHSGWMMDNNCIFGRPRDPETDARSERIHIYTIGG